MRKALLFSLFALALAAPSFLATAEAVAKPRAKPSHARPPVVVELYTAQGCASCGEASAYVGKLAERPGVHCGC